MAEIPLRHSSHTRTLLPGLRRKSSIRRHTPRSQWEQIIQNVSFSSSGSSSSNPINRTTASSLPVPVVIKPPKHTQRILKYDPITGNAYNNNISNGSIRNYNSDSIISCPHNSILLSLLAMIPRSKLSRSLWKMTVLVSFLYINLHLFHLQVEHDHISELLASMVNIEPYQLQLSSSLVHFSHNHHRRLHPHRYHALRGSVTTMTKTSTEENQSQHNDHPNHLLRGSKTVTNSINKDEWNTNPNQDRLAPVKKVTNALPDVISPPTSVVETATLSSNETNENDIPITGTSSTSETSHSEGEDLNILEKLEKVTKENEDSTNDDDAEEEYVLTSHEESSAIQ